MIRRRWLSGICCLSVMNMLSLRSAFAAAQLVQEQSDVAGGMFDVIVVGSGMAGHCAAISAKLSGARRVLIVDKAPLAGGHTALASGSIAFVDARRQARQGIEDSVEKFIEDARAAGGDINEEIVRCFAQNSGPAIDWLQSQGVRFAPNIFRAYGGLHPRCLTAFGNIGARYYISKLHEKSRELGIETRLLTKAEGLHRFEENLLALRLLDKRTNSEYMVQAPSIVLATGGFGANLALRMRYRPELDHEIPTTANPRGLAEDPATGDGLFLAQSLGAAWVDMDRIVMLSYWGGRMLDYIGAEIYVDSEGRRFVDETATTSKIAKAIAALAGRSMFVITDAKSDKGVNVGAKIAAGSIHRSDSVAEMAREMKVSAVQLQRTLDEFNKCAQDNKQDRFGRRTYLQTIDQPPFYWGQERLMVHATLGGLSTDAKARVQSESGSVIEGLFAAGEVAGGIWGSDRLGGTGLLQCLVQGKIAGIEAARCAAVSARRS